MPMMNARVTCGPVSSVCRSTKHVFSVRGFNRAPLPPGARLEQVGTSVVHYYNLAVAEGCGATTSPNTSGSSATSSAAFAHEGAAMGLFAIDALAPFSRGNFDRFIRGPAKNHVYMSFIGAGLAIGALRLRFEGAVSKSRTSRGC